MTAISAQTLDFFISQESARHQAFSHVWTKELNQVFADVANYYDRANHVASLGLWSWFRVGFVSTIDLRPHDRVLDVCSENSTPQFAETVEITQNRHIGVSRVLRILVPPSVTVGSLRSTH